MKLFAKLFNKGFSLIELMVVIAIIAIIAAVAVPAYNNYSTRATVSSAVAVGNGVLKQVLAAFPSTNNQPASVGSFQAGVPLAMTNEDSINFITYGGGTAPNGDIVGYVLVTMNSSLGLSGMVDGTGGCGGGDAFNTVMIGMRTDADGNYIQFCGQPGAGAPANCGVSLTVLPASCQGTNVYNDLTT